MSEKNPLKPDFSEAFFAALLAAAKGDKETTYQIMKDLADKMLSKYIKTSKRK